MTTYWVYSESLKKMVEVTIPPTWDDEGEEE